MAEYAADPGKHHQQPFGVEISTRSHHSTNNPPHWRAFLSRPEHEGTYSIVGRSRTIVDGSFLWTYEVRCSHWLTLFAFGLQYDCNG